MRWRGQRVALLFGLLIFLNFKGNCAPETSTPELVGGRRSATQSRGRSEASAPLPQAQDIKNTESYGLKVAANVGLLAEDSDAETEHTHGVLEKHRGGIMPRVSRNLDMAEQQSQSQADTTVSEGNDGELTCSRLCKEEWLGDGWCDTVCNNKACGFDDGDCKGWCAGDCKPSWLGDGFCDAACYVDACNWDGGDCEAWRRQGVRPIDRRMLLQQQRKLKQRRLPLPDCTCKHRLLVNGSCTPECNTPECLFDGGECLDTCNAKCSLAWLGDGGCDRECDTPECDHDKGDCDSATNAAVKAARAATNDTDVCNSACRLWMIGNGVCDTQCNNTGCGFDGGDCDNVSVVLEVDYTAKPEVYQFCAKEWIGDGHCDKNCYNKPSNWDEGDCEGTPLEKELAAKRIGPQFDG